MGVADWMRAFRTLHERAKAGGLAGEDAEAYRAGCDELARALMAAQRIALAPGETPRLALRVARAVQVDLESATSHVRAMTIDLGAGGFSALLAKAPPADEELKCRMKIPGAEPIETTIALVDVKQQPGSARASFSFPRLPEADRAKIEMLVIDTALSNIAA